MHANMNRESTERNPARTRSLIRYSVLRVRDDPPVLRDPNSMYVGPSPWGTKLGVLTTGYERSDIPKKGF